MEEAGVVKLFCNLRKTGSGKNHQVMLNLGENFVEKQGIYAILKHLRNRH